MSGRARAAAVAGIVACAAAVAWLALRDRAPSTTSPRAADAQAAPGARPTWQGERIVATSTLVDDALIIAPVGRPEVRASLAGRGALAPSGAPAVPMSGGWLVPLSRPSSPRDALLIIAPSGDARVVELPSSDRVAAARAAEPPELVLVGAGDGGAVAIVRAAVRPDGSLDERERATVPYTPSLVIEPVPELRCGVPGERFTPLLGRAPGGGVLIAVADDRLYPLRFPRSAAAVVTPVCGPCPPLAVSRDGDDVTLLVNVGRKLARSPVGVPARPVRAASGACTGAATVVALAAGDGVWIATSSDGSWRLDAPTRVAGPAPEGAPVDVALEPGDGRLELSFRRERAGARERLTSLDGGRPWR